MTSKVQAVPHTSQPLSEWLAWLETIHPVAIDMGLDRVSRVADTLALRPVQKPLILVGGTNGKGSVVTMLSAIYRKAGYCVGAYTSPHIMHFCERIRVDGEMVDEQAVVDALAFIEQGRADVSLTYFEYTTLAAMRIFQVRCCDVLLFEVGLGGRLDATNIWDAYCSVITSIGLDHEQYLGSDISVIATEKAAIGRAGKPFVVGEKSPPSSLAAYAVAHDFKLLDVGSKPLESLPEPSMPGEHQRRNAGCAMAAVNALEIMLPVPPHCLTDGLNEAQLAGRFEKITINGVTVVMDVAHNQAGAEALKLAWISEFGTVRADIVFAILADKDAASVVRALAPVVDTWHCTSLPVARAATVQNVIATVKQHADSAMVNAYNATNHALKAALKHAKESQRAVLIAGSFYTIEQVKKVLEDEGIN